MTVRPAEPGAAPGAARTGPGPRDTVIYAGAFEFPDRNAAAQRAVANACIFRDLGYRVILVGLSRDLPEGAPPHRLAADLLPFETWELPYPVGRLAWLRRIVSGADLLRLIEDHYADSLAGLILYDYPAVAQERLRRAARRRGAFAIGEATEWYSVSRLRSVAAAVRNLDRPLRMRWVNRRMDGMIVASEFLRDFYAAAGQPTVELPTLLADRSPVAVPPAAPGAGRPRRLFFAGSGFDPESVAASVDGPKDRLDTVIEALGAARAMGADFVLDVFGVTRPDYLAVRPDHAGLVADLGERIQFHGRQPRESIRRILAEADYSIFLRKDTRVSRAGFPTKFGESVHFGTPVITNALGSLTKYHVEGRTGWYIDYDDVQRAGRRLAEILNADSAEVSAMKDWCRASNLFHYAGYVAPVGRFMATLSHRGP